MSDFYLIAAVCVGTMAPIVVLSLVDRYFAKRRLQAHDCHVSRITIFYPPNNDGSSLNFRKGGWLLEYMNSAGVSRKVLCRSGLCGRFRPFHREWVVA
jgi:hypothetical protein